MYVDAHAHMTDTSFDKDRDKILENIKNIVIMESGLNYENNLDVMKLSREYDCVKPCIGFHPEFVVNSTVDDADRIIEYIYENKEEIVGLSEIGLDYKFGFKEKQHVIFKKFLTLAEEIRLPVIVHSRWAAGAVIRVMKNFDLSVDLHAFSGTIEEAKKAVDLGYFLSFGPNLVFNKFRQQMLETIPLENILTETDSPVLGPKHGERNIPNNITLAIKKISEIKDLTVNDSEKEVYRNSKKIFKFL